MGNDTKYDQLMNWFKNRWFFVILIFLAVFFSAAFGFINTIKKGVDNIKEVTETVAAPAPSTPSPATTSQKIIKGQFIDAHGVPIPQARIAITGLGEQSHFTNTDDEGYFSKALQSQGLKSLTLRCDHRGFQKYTLNFQMDFSNAETMDLASITLLELPKKARPIVKHPKSNPEKVKPDKASPEKDNPGEVVIDNKGTIGVISTGDNATFEIKQEFNTHADKDTTRKE